MATHGRQHGPELLSPGSTNHSEPNVGYRFIGLSGKSYGGPGFYDRLIQSKKNDFGIDTVT